VGLSLIRTWPPKVELHPEVVFLLSCRRYFTPAAWYTSWCDFRFKAYLLLAIGSWLPRLLSPWLHTAISGLTWATAFVLGAIVSPPDAVAATAIQRLNVP